MRYLGRIAGEGALLHNGDEVARASYDLEGYIGRRGALVGSGEIEIPPTVLESIFGARGLQLRSDDGRWLDLKFSGKEVPSATGVAQVEVSGDLANAPAEWGGPATLAPTLAASEAYVQRGLGADVADNV
jgi:hypothetical protein